MKKLLLPLFVLGLSACVVTPSNSSLSSIPSSNSLSDSSISSSDVVSVIIEAEEALEVYERLYNEFVGSFDNIDGYTLTNAMHSEGVGSPEIFELEYDILGFLTTTATLNVNYETVAMYEELSTEIIYTNLDGSPLDIEMPIEIPIELLNNSEKNLAFYDFDNSQMVVINVENEELVYYDTISIEEAEVISVFKEECNVNNVFNNTILPPSAELDYAINDPDLIIDFTFLTNEERTFIDIFSTVVTIIDITEVPIEVEEEIYVHLDATTAKTEKTLPIFSTITVYTKELSLLAPEIDVHILDSYLPLED